MAKTKKPPEKDEVAVTFRIPREIHAALVAAAEADDRSQNSYAVRVLRAHFEAEKKGRG